MTARRRGLAAVLAGAILVTPVTLGAARAPESAPAALCLPLIFTCPQPSPSPSPTTPAGVTPAPGAGSPTAPAQQPGTPATGLPGPPPLPGTPGADPGTPTAPGDPASPGAPPSGTNTSPTPSPGSTKPVAAPRDAGTPVFTRTPASMGSKGLSFTGLLGISIVTVPTSDGGTVRALKITADSITITGFSLTVRPPGGAGLVTTADTMTLSGHVSVYLGSVTATTQNGRSLTLGTDTPPPLDDVAPGLLRVTMGLVGSIAESITYTNTDQRIVQP
ncbi:MULTISPECIES: hypothetical protein [Arthrobacter]|uniref:Uncharacterized protein n=2 Tax=Arthrobacter TaxID=1663 RepID=A0ABU9KRF8_9MICC|nr:hypothetical protein [Arthrobacter sp. YJM1]MDP5227988.1 hypothetical protein [Arthrobacter sp. YJM1]